MPIYRKYIIVIANNLFRLLLFFSVSIVAILIIYTDRSYIPTSLERSNTYQRFVSSLLETNKKQSLTVGGDVTLDDPVIQKIISDAFPASELEQHTNNVINAFYDWLEQKSSVFAFSIDLTANKQRLAEGLSDYAVNRLRNLPECTEFSSEIDPFSATCQPSNIDYAQERATLVEQFMNESGFLEDTVITQEILSGDPGESIESKYSNVPILYSLATLSPIYIALFLSSLALIVIFASSTRKIGLRKIGRSMVGAGVSLIFFTVLFSFVLPRFTGSLPLLETTGDGVDALLNDITIDFSQDYAWMIIKISAPLIVIGLVMIVYAQSGKNKKSYKAAKLKSGVVSSNEQKKTSAPKKARPPVQSSESSDTKPKRTHKNSKYRKIPKKEI
jgi:hypothetical protein